jgi:hypothetical protein
MNAPRLQAKGWRRLAPRLFLVIITTIATLALGEIVVRLSLAVTHHAPLVVSDAQSGWALKPNLRDEIHAGEGGQYQISTDREGHRLTSAPGAPGLATDPTVLLVGDSFTQGAIVDDSETFAWILAMETSWHIVNLGVLGYGTDQELLGLVDYLEAHPSLSVSDIVVLVFENDFVDVQTNYYPPLARSKPRFGIVDGKLNKPPYRLSLSDHLMDVSRLYGLLNGKRDFLLKDRDPDGADGVELVIACLESMRALAKIRGARFHVLAHRYLRNPGQFLDRPWDDFVKRAGAQDITPLLGSMTESDPIGYDGGHWSPAGHRLVATIVKEQLSGTADKKAVSP